MVGDDLPFYVTRAGNGVYRVDVWVQPGASRNELAGEYQGRLKVRVAAPANDNKANKTLAAFFAETLGLKSSHVELASGFTGRKKTLFVRTDRYLSWPAGVPAAGR